MKIVNVGIIGTGNIARKMAATLVSMPDEVDVYAVASRSEAAAQAFAKEWSFKKAYGSYEAMLEDENVDLVYIATPNSLHYENMMMCLDKGKAVLCEKPFTANAAQAREVLEKAREKNVFVAEAMWTRYMPLSKTINELIASKVIGAPKILSANLGYNLSYVERMDCPELGGGTLLDLGVYLLNFAAMVFGSGESRMVSVCTRTEHGLDGQESITLVYPDNRMAVMHATMYAPTDRSGVISGEKGHIIVDNINNPQRVTVVDSNYDVKAVYDCPKQITGFEYEVYAAVDAMKNGRIEPALMPHAETLRIMQQMDSLRSDWGVKFPFE